MTALSAAAGAKKIEKKDAPQLYNVVEEMTIASGFGRMPDVYLIQESSPNAFAIGRKPEKSAVANYGFDVTPARLVTGLVTERGRCPATPAGLARLRRAEA